MQPVSIEAELEIISTSFMFEHEPWRDNAACKEADPTLFFPKRGDSTKEAKAYCASCPVNWECGDYAERSGTEYGIWGGKTLQRGLKTTKNPVSSSQPDEPGEQIGTPNPIGERG